MRRRIVLTAAGVIALAGVGAAAWLVQWSVKRTQEEARAGRLPRPPRLRGPQAKIVRPRVEAYDRNGKLAWALSFDEIELSGGDVVSATSLRDGVIYDADSGKGIARVMGDTVTYNLASKNFDLSGNVRVAHIKGLLLTMARASYIEADKRIMCTGGVVGRQEAVTVTTDSASYWPQQNVVQCPGTVQWRTEQGTRLSGRNLRVDFDAKRLTMADASGRINIKEAESRFRGGTTG